MIVCIDQHNVAHNCKGGGDSKLNTGRHGRDRIILWEEDLTMDGHRHSLSNLVEIELDLSPDHQIPSTSQESTTLSHEVSVNLL